VFEIGERGRTRVVVHRGRLVQSVRADVHDAGASLQPTFDPAAVHHAEQPADVQATLLELSAATIANALLAQQPHTQRVLVCGGGVRNERLIARIGALLPQARVESTAIHGLDPDFLEAMAFAWLARQTLAGLPGNLPGVTGARGPRVLGAIYPA